MNKNEELKFADFFINWLNKGYCYDYSVVPNDNEDKEDPEIDIYAVSNKMKLRPLNLQIVTSEGDIYKEKASLRNKSRKTKENIVMGSEIDLNSTEWIKYAIESKERKYPKDVKKSLILLIEKDIGPLFNENYFNMHFREYNTSDFKGIFLVHSPSLKENSSIPHDGQILAIKNFYRGF